MPSRSMPRCSGASCAGCRGVGEDADYVFNRLGRRFTEEELNNRLNLLERQQATRKQAKRIVTLIRRIAERSLWRHPIRSRTA